MNAASHENKCVHCLHYGKRTTTIVPEEKIAIWSAKLGFVFKSGDYTVEVILKQRGSTSKSTTRSSAVRSSEYSLVFFVDSSQFYHPANLDHFFFSKAHIQPTCISIINITSTHLVPILVAESKANIIFWTQRDNQTYIIVHSSQLNINCQLFLSLTSGWLQLWTGARSVEIIDELVQSICSHHGKVPLKILAPRQRSLLSSMLYLRSGLTWRHVANLFQIDECDCCKEGLSTLDSLYHLCRQACQIDWSFGCRFPSPISFPIALSKSGHVG